MWGFGLGEIMSLLKIHSKIYSGVTCKDVWNAWADLSSWHLWNPGIEKAWISGKFESGNSFYLKPVNMSKPIRIELIEAEVEARYIDCTKFFLAKMYGEHFVDKTEHGVKLTTIVRVEGLLKYFWIWLVASTVANKMEKQMDQMIHYIKNKRV